MYNLYERIIELCNQKGVSAGKMCSEVGISRGLITDLKMGRKSNPTAATMAKIASYFGVSVDYLLGKEEKPASDDADELNEYLEELKNRPEMRMLFSLAKGATKEDVEQAVKIIEALRK